VGGVQMAIVKVPNEPDRYVREGQRIANGQVLVKRIETNRGPNPVVILEQYGVEVARGVGDAPSTSPGGAWTTPTTPNSFSATRLDAKPYRCVFSSLTRLDSLSRRSTKNRG
jgi:hypothetical protein